MQNALNQTEDVLKKLTCQYDELVSCAQLYDSATHEAKKMIVSQLIQRVEVSRGYQVSITFRFDLNQFLGLPVDPCAG